jgi:hypothetical protein
MSPVAAPEGNPAVIAFIEDAIVPTDLTAIAIFYTTLSTEKLNRSESASNIKEPCSARNLFVSGTASNIKEP